MNQAVENFKDCVGAQLAAVKQPELQAWSAQTVGKYVAWAVESLRTSRHGTAAAMELAAWWDSHPRNPLNSQA